MAINEPPYRFLDDRPAEDDFFSGYASALARIVQICETPFTIGLLGTWRSGKATVIDILRRQLKDSPNLTLVYLDVWKFSRDPIKRWVLIEMEKQLGLHGATYGVREIVAGTLAPRRDRGRDLSPIYVPSQHQT